MGQGEGDPGEGAAAPGRHVTLTAEQVLRVSAATAFLPQDDLWVDMSLARKRQVIAEIVEFALVGTCHTQRRCMYLAHSRGEVPWTP